MKTAFASPLSYSPLGVVNQKGPQAEKAKMKAVVKTDLRNHRFAIIDNKVVQDPRNWDEAWFGNYE